MAKKDLLKKEIKKIMEFQARVHGENQFGKPFSKTIIVKGKSPRSAYTELKTKNDINDIEWFFRI